MKQKLQGMPGWEAINDNQDGISLIKLLHKVYFDTDESKQSIQEIITAHKKLYLWFQKKDWSLDEWTREFTARQEVWEQLGFSPGQSLYTARMATSEDGESYDTSSEGNDDNPAKA